MKLKVLGCFGGDLRGRLPGFLINDVLLMDAGTIGIALDVEAQRSIHTVLLTHHHIDHLVGLPFFIDAVFSDAAPGVEIRAIPDVIRHIRNHLFNNIIWPDFSRLPDDSQPFITFEPLTIGREYSCGSDLTYIPVTTCHAGPSCGYLLRSGTTCIAYSGDTGTCPEFWAEINGYLRDHPEHRLAALVIECSFPSRMHEFARRTHHLSTNLLQKELTFLDSPDTEILVFHMKPRHIQEIEAEIKTITSHSIRLLQPNEVFQF